MKGTELPAAAQGTPSRRCTGPMRQEPASQENAAEERQTEGIVEYQA